MAGRFVIKKFVSGVARARRPISLNSSGSTCAGAPVTAPASGGIFRGAADRLGLATVLNDLHFNNRALHDLFHGASVRPSSSNHMVNGCAARSLSKFTCSRSAARTVWSTRSPFLNVSSMKLAAQRHPFSSSASNEAFEARLEAINKKFNKRMKYLMWCCGFISFSIVATLRQFDLPEEEAPGGCDGSCKTDSVHGDRSAPWTK